MVMTEGVEFRRKAVGGPDTTPDELLFPYQHRLVDREHLQVDISLTAGSPDSTPRWDAATIWNKALQVMVYAEKSVRRPKAGSLAVAATSSESFFRNGKAAGVDASPRDVMSLFPTEDSWISPKKNSYTLVGASCSRGSTTKRSRNGNEPSTSTLECASSICFDSPTNNKKSSSNDYNNDNNGGTPASFLSDVQNKLPMSMTINSAPEAGATSLGSSAMLGQVASASMAIMQKAMSAPMKRGILSKRKEKQD
ncbi:hypothetical protein VaNZ11_008482 [Volvox africanus]|uniref:Uncharacterized protein n=1 Tax=Volvox africanus TaxID=51714 RepID=A0ABQ5S5D2_9CHLO|nr:hypothetical protein VaNZ11_008482 [Volvox africanus]